MKAAACSEVIVSASCITLVLFLFPFFPCGLCPCTCSSSSFLSVFGESRGEERRGGMGYSNWAWLGSKLDEEDRRGDDETASSSATIVGIGRCSRSEEERRGRHHDRHRELD